MEVIFLALVWSLNREKDIICAWILYRWIVNRWIVPGEPNNLTKWTNALPLIEESQKTQESFLFLCLFADNFRKVMITGFDKLCISEPLTSIAIMWDPSVQFWSTFKNITLIYLNLHTIPTNAWRTPTKI